MTQPPVILASTSTTRINMLRAVGLDFMPLAAELDEEALHLSHTHLDPPELSLELAKAKAMSLTAKYSNSWIIGSDQVLDFQGKPLHKAKSIEEARAKLKALRGHTHKLHSAVAIAHEGRIVFSDVQSVVLIMRHFSSAFLDDYLVKARDAALNSAGCYHYEGLGAQLFDQVEGDYHAILGLPLLPLLAFLRQASILAS